MKESVKSALEHQKDVQKNNPNNVAADTKNNEGYPTLEQLITQTVKDQNTDARSMDSNKIKQAFVKHHIEMRDTLSLIERIFERFIVELNGNSEVSQILNEQLRSSVNQNNNQANNQNNNQDNNQLRESGERIATFIKDNKLNGDKYNRFNNTLVGLQRIFSSNNIEPQALDLILKICDTENYIADSFKKGVIEGRNQKIEEHISQTLSIDGLYNNSASIKPSSSEDGYIERLLRN